MSTPLSDAHEDTPRPATRIITVSNRLPIQADRDGDEIHLQESPGGLVRALSAVMRRHGGVWVGWPGITGQIDLSDALDDQGVDIGYPLRAVELSKEDRDLFYKGFSNEVIWPLFHDLHTYCDFDPSYWKAYEQVNVRFAETTAPEVRPGDFIWVHDYHLMRVGLELRHLGVDVPLAFFLHIPFPAPDLFMKMPWREDILEGLLGFDIVGFQTVHDRENFLATVRRMRPEAAIRNPDGIQEVHLEDRVTRVGAFPIGIDPQEIEDIARSPYVADAMDDMHRRHGDVSFVLGIDRLDYTKGIPARLRAFRRLLERRPDLHGEVTLLQHVAPSREDVDRYPDLKETIERLVGSINGRFGTLDWTPVQYMYNQLPFIDLIAFYRLANVMLVTSLKDGMNLVSKEYCAAHPDEDGVLVVSEFAGAATGFGENALQVNPHDVEQVASAIERALRMPREERRIRMREMRQQVYAYDAFVWVETFLRHVGRSLESTDLKLLR